MKKFSKIIKESKEDFDIEKYSIIIDDIKSLIENTVENIGGDLKTFVSSFNKAPEDHKIEGLINDSDIYDFYLKHRNDIDEILNNINYFDEIPSDNNIVGLYDYIINGTERVIKELVREL